jgi:hypothetical protein
MPGRLGHGPAVVIVRLHQQAAGHVPAGRAGLTPGKAWRDPRQKVVEQAGVRGIAYADTSGYCVIFMFHKPA